MKLTWIKLYRKLKLNPIMRDSNALQLFIWVLLNADKDTGEVAFGRFIVAKELKTNPNTLYSSLKRLVSKYKVVTIMATGGYTTIRLVKWAIYQPNKSDDNTSDNTSTTTPHHLDTTYTRIENKRTKNIINNEETKNSDEFSELKETMGIPTAPIKGITHEFQDQAIRIIKALGVPESRKSAYFKAIKEEPRGNILDAYAFAQDYADPKARDGMFFWKLNALKGGKSENIQANN